MLYQEIQAPAFLSKHVESFWEMTFQPGEQGKLEELMLPTCTFNMLFLDQEIRIKSQIDKTWKKLKPGASFMGQSNSYISFSSKEAVRVFGIRFKPFAFANIIKSPIHLLNDQVLTLDQLFRLDKNRQKFIAEIIACEELEERSALTSDFLLQLFEESLFIDQTLRAQLNYILDRKGIIKIKHLFSEFGVSKVTLRKHFINKVGLTPKKVSRIWRMNYFFQLKERFPTENLTSLCLMADFYDQAHFIREFKSMFGCTPRTLLQNNSELLKVSQKSISRRFTNQYDPR